MWDSVVQITLVSDILTYNWLCFRTVISPHFSVCLCNTSFQTAHDLDSILSKIFCPPAVIPNVKIRAWPAHLHAKAVDQPSYANLQLLFFRPVGTPVLMVTQNTGITPFPLRLWILFMSAAFTQHGVSLQWKQRLQWMKRQSRTVRSKGAFPWQCLSAWWTWQICTNWPEWMMGFTFPCLGQRYFRNSEFISRSSTCKTTPWSLVMVSWAQILNSGRRGEFLLSGWPDHSAYLLSPQQAGLLFFFISRPSCSSLGRQVWCLPRNFC